MNKKSFLVDMDEAEEADLSLKIDALRCDIVKSALFSERKRIACAILELVRKDPMLQDTDEELLSGLCVEAMFYFGDDVFEALKALEQHRDSSVEEKIVNLQMVFLSYFDLRTLR